MIESFGFGSINIDGRIFHSDLIIYPDGRIENRWRRIKEHCLTGDDIAELIRTQPEIIVAGTGVNGYMRPEAHLPENLKQEGISFMADKNEIAIKTYNRLISDHRVGACFHLTC